MADPTGQNPGVIDGGEQQINENMAAVTVTKDVSALRTLFNKVGRIYFTSTTDKTPANLATLDFRLPILEDSVEFDTGEPDIETVNLTTGEKWTTMTTAGDPNITMQCASFATEITDLFLNVTAASSGNMTLDGRTYAGKGYDLSAKKVTGGLLLMGEDLEMAIFMPHVEIYSSIGIEQNVPGYFTMNVTPLASSADNTAIYFLPKTSA
jgi:hypothetical protein